jgi:polyferredoxin
MNRQTRLSRIRRASQVLFLGAFLLLLFRTEFSGSFRAAGGEARLPWPVSIFLEADPLAAVATAISTRTLYSGLLWSLVVLVPTFFLGRFFCGWICPLGTLNHFFGSLRSEKKRGKALLESNRYKPWHAVKYYVLAAVLVSALFGSLLAGLLDPIPLTVRSLALSYLPAANYATSSLLDRLYASDLASVRFAADALQFVLQGTLATFKQPHFRQAVFVGLIFTLVLAVNLRVTRFWCRAVCPLGGLLGLASRWSLLHLKKDPSACDDCRRCLLHCQGGDDPIPGPAWRKSECHLCFNCVGDCPTRGVAFAFGAPPRDKSVREAPEVQRRKLITGVAAGAVFVPLLRTTTGLKVEADSRLIRPPGALDETHFLERCIRCGECMKVCPNNALHPTFMEGGLEALWTPVLVARVGYCEPNCVLCGQVCPTGAIWKITEAEKLGKPPGAAKPAADSQAAKANPIKIGTAFYDQGRCLPWAMATDCIVCEEWCPTSPKAIYLVTTEVQDAEGQAKSVRRPHVDAKRCIGCGACEYACPVKDRPAVYVTSVGETRSKTNQFILPSAPRRN